MHIYDCVAQLIYSQVFALCAPAVDFGFTKVLWVYSGRRGVHAWVCDDIPLKFDRTQRSAVLQYLSPVKVGSRQSII